VNIRLVAGGGLWGRFQVDRGDTPVDGGLERLPGRRRSLPPEKGRESCQGPGAVWQTARHNRTVHSGTLALRLYSLPPGGNEAWQATHSDPP